MTAEELPEVPVENVEKEVDSMEVREAGNICSVGHMAVLKPSKYRPSGKHGSRIGFIVDSGASNSTLPVGTPPNHDVGPAVGYKEYCMADGRIVPNLGTKSVKLAFQCGKVMGKA